MVRWLAVLFIVGALGGATLAAYPALLIGSNGLVSMANGMKAISAAASTFYTTVSNGQTTLLKTYSDLLVNMNNTLLAFNKTFANNSVYVQAIQGALSSVQQYSYYGNPNNYPIAGITYEIGRDIQTIAQASQQILDQLFSGFQTLSYSSMYYGKDPVAYENCLVSNSTALQAANVSIARFSYCLSNQTNVIANVTTIANAMIQFVRAEYNRNMALSKTCGAIPDGKNCTDCWDYFFSDAIYDGLSMELYVVVMIVQYAAWTINSAMQVCTQLTSYDINDIMQGIQMNMMYCR